MTTPQASRMTTLTPADREWIATQVANAPKLTARQRDQLAELLRPVRVAGGDVVQ